jgi:hypothetical protein
MKQGVSMEDTGAGRFSKQIQLLTEQPPENLSSPLDEGGS